MAAPQQQQSNVLLVALQEVLDAVDEVGGRFIVTADHGNADDMVQHAKGSREPKRDKEGKPVPLTSHTLWPVRDFLC